MRRSFTPTFYSGQDTVAFMLQMTRQGDWTAITHLREVAKLEGAADGAWSAIMLIAGIGKSNVTRFPFSVQDRLIKLAQRAGGANKPVWVDRVLERIHEQIRQEELVKAQTLAATAKE